MYLKVSSIRKFKDDFDDFDNDVNSGYLYEVKQTNYPLLIIQLICFILAVDFIVHMLDFEHNDDSIHYLEFKMFCCDYNPVKMVNSNKYHFYLLVSEPHSFSLPGYFFI